MKKVWQFIDKNMVLLAFLTVILVAVILDTNLPPADTPPGYTYIETKVFDVAGEGADMYLLRFLKDGQIIELQAYSEIGVDNIYREMMK